MVKTRTRTIAGSSLIGVGGFLLLLVSGYAVYASQATASLGSLNVDRSNSLEKLLSPKNSSLPLGSLGAPSPQQDSSSLSPKSAEQSSLSPSTEATGHGLPDDVIPPEGQQTEGGGPLPDSATPGPAAPQRWTSYPLDPLVAGSSEVSLSGGNGDTLVLGLQDFELIDWSALPKKMGSVSEPTRIQIPAIDLDSEIGHVDTSYVGKSLIWNILPNVVGHHAGTFNPGEFGTAVLSGHISSPISRQGAIFRRLPEVAQLLNNDEFVDVIIWNDEARYLYRIYQTQVQQPEDVDLFRPAAQPGLMMITCVPDGVYSHRLLVHAVLLGTAPLP